MSDPIVSILLDEGKWLPFAMLVSALAMARGLLRRRRPVADPLEGVGAAMSLFFGWMIGIMAGGHLLAVTLKAASGALSGSLGLLYPIGLALAVPAWWLAASAQVSDGANPNKLLALNLWLGLTLLALGLHNWPLAAPAGLNIAYLKNSKRALAWTLVAVTATAYLALFVGSLLFLASGETFEQFMGIE